MDGSRNALDVLTNIIKAPLKSNTPSTTTTSTTGGGKQSNNSTVFPLTRPLICICNDQYAPVLKEIRQLSDIFVFTAPKELRLVQRLRDICKLEGLHLTNSMCITELCNATGHDIRASINNLQFAAIRSRNQYTIDQHHNHQTNHHHHPSKNMMDIGRVLQNMIRSGLKDGQLDIFQIWKSIFTVQSMTTSMQQSSTSIHSLVDDEAYAIATGTQQQQQQQQQHKQVKVDCSMKVMDAMLSYGDHQQVISGIFENIHSIDPLDPAFTKHAIGSDWVSFADELQAFMPTARDGFQLHPYIASVAGAVYCHNSINRRITLSWPKKDREMHYKGASKQSILQCLLDGSDIHSLRISKNVSPSFDIL